MDDTFARVNCATCGKTTRISWRSINTGWMQTAVVLAQQAHKKISPKCEGSVLPITQIPRPWWFWFKFLLNNR